MQSIKDTYQRITDAIIEQLEARRSRPTIGAGNVFHRSKADGS